MIMNVRSIDIGVGNGIQVLHYVRLLTQFVYSVLYKNKDIRR